MADHSTGQADARHTFSQVCCRVAPDPGETCLQSAAGVDAPSASPCHDELRQTFVRYHEPGSADHQIGLGYRCRRRGAHRHQHTDAPVPEFRFELRDLRRCSHVADPSDGGLGGTTRKRSEPCTAVLRARGGR